MVTKRITPFLICLLFVFLLAACGGGEEPIISTESAVEEPAVEEMEEDVAPYAVGSEDGGGSPHEPGSGPKTAVTRTSSSGWVDESGAAAAEGAIARSGEADLAAEPAAEMEVMEESEEAMAAVAAPSDAFSTDSDDAEIAPEPLATMPAGAESRSAEAEDTTLTLDQTSRLSAGDVDDNAKWDEYISYRQSYSGARVLDVDIRERHQIMVSDSAGNSVLGALIRIAAEGQEVAVLRTHSDGRAYFYPNALPAQSQADSYAVTVLVDNQEETFTLESGGSQNVWEVNHPAADQTVPEARLDVLFLIDATGSMADEIQQLKENIRAIAARIDALPTAPDVRFGMTVYRDRGDEFVSRTFEFTPDVDFFAEGLADVIADGGGDYPEDLNEGLFKAIHVPEWRVEETVSLIFLVADAPPHLDYDDQESDYALEMHEASERGIKIYPIASSGLDAQGEYVFRQLAQYTGGRFLFLTYGAGGAGTTGTETTHEVEGYDVTSLDGLVIKIVEEELAPLAR